jgi:hypothetical protein
MPPVSRFGYLSRFGYPLVGTKLAYYLHLDTAFTTFIFSPELLAAPPKAPESG